MTTNIRPELARVPRMGDVVSVAGGFLNNLTKAALQITNDTMNLLNNNNNNNHIISDSTQTKAANVFILTTPSTTTHSPHNTLMPTLETSSINAASIVSTTALQWLQQHPNSQLPATMKITDSTYAFLTNLTYTNSNVYIPATAGPTIEDDEIRLEHAPQLSKSAMIKVYVLTIMALFSLLGNVLTMWNIYKTRLARRNSRHSWSAIYSLIFHLSIADVLVTGFCIIGEAAWCYTVQWLANDLTCKLVKLFQMFSLYLSTYVLVLIGVDRWIAVKYPMKSLNMAKRCYRLLGGTYILSLLLSLPQFFIFRVARGPFIEEFYQCVTHGFYTAEWQEQLYATFTLVFTFLLPLCILFGTYMSTFRTISNSEKMFQGSKLAGYNSNKPTSQTNRQRLIHKAKMKSLRISVVIIFAFLICWTPYNVMMLIFMFWNPDKRFGEDLQSAIFFFGMSNSLVNPLIYGAFHLCPMKRKTSKKSYNNNGTYSLNRGDSQRTPSMLTAVTQVDGNGRQVRTFRQSSYYRSISTGSAYKENIGLLQTTGSSLSATTINVPLATPSLTRKSASMKSPHPNQRALVTSCPANSGSASNSVHKHNFNHRKTAATAAAAATQQYHNHSTEIIQNDNSVSSCSSVGRSDDSSDRACLSSGGISGNGGGGVSIVLSYDNQRGGAASMKKRTSSSSSPLNGGENRNCLLTQTTVNAMGLQPLLSGIEDSVSSV
ncbi:neuropeptide SIFamide receptor [Calliphora vicina]|uniref:neuropeptide SIFamide receptor n=1 Tax=Calliphora vicina TaxID=7373 RepID=UPI00325BA498